MDKLIDMFGWTMLMELAGLASLFFLVVLFPLWWPAWRAWKHRLPQPWLFGATLAALSYGQWMLLSVVTVIPGSIYEIYFAPQLHEAGLTEYGPLDVALQWWMNYWWLAIWPLQGLLTVWLTRWLGRRWAGVWRALSDRAMA